MPDLARRNPNGSTDSIDVYNHLRQKVTLVSYADGKVWPAGQVGTVPDQPPPVVEPTVVRSPTYAELKAPVIFSHRGGEMFPENTMRAWDKLLADPEMSIDADFQVGADGELLASHDATTLRTSAEGINKAVNTYTEATWPSVLQAWPTTSTWTNQDDVPASTGRQLMDKYAGYRLLGLEPKSPAAYTRLRQVIQEYEDRVGGVKERTFFNSFDVQQCIDMKKFGCVTGVSYSGNPNVAAVTGPDATHPLIDYAILYTTYATQANIEALSDVGIKVLVLQVRSKTQMQTYLSRGAYGFATDVPWTLKGTSIPADGVTSTDPAGFGEGPFGAGTFGA